MSVTTDHSRTLQQAGQLIRAGRLAEAAALGEAALGGGSDPVLHAMVGTIALKIGQHDRAVTHLDRAHQARPEDQTVRMHLVEALAGLGQAERAWSLLPPSPADAAQDPALAWRAYLAQETGRFDQAVPLYREIVRRDSKDWSSWNNLGNSLNALGQDAEAVEALRRAVALVPDAAPIRLNLANVLMDLGEGEPARQELLELTRRDPADAKAWGTLSTLYKRAGHEDDSFDALCKSASLSPGDPAVLTDYGNACAFRNMFDEAQAVLDRALTLDPTLSAAYLGLGNILERTNREGELPALLERAASGGASAEALHFLRALKLKRDGNFEDALVEVDQAGEAVIHPRRRQVRGQILDRLGRAEEAWGEFTEMNRFWEEDPTKPLERARAYVELTHAEMDRLSPQWLASWTTSPPLNRRTPVFLVGFPRSGTTLLDTMLMGHPDARVLEETPFIAEVERELGGNERFPNLSADAIAEAQASYFAKVATLVDLAGNPLVVDKQPLNLNRVPTIKRLFPDAKFILALRHPLDVLLSCYVTNFRPNMGMANFLRLEDAANLYDLTFAYWEKAQRLFGLDVHTIVYERMVEDPAGQLKPLVEWMGLDWRDELLDHQKTASSRGHISTASYAQVVEPIYTRSKGRWQRYAKHLEPIIPTVRPWIDKFGYDL
jgi:Flp pilus assembly protein TadD